MPIRRKWRREVEKTNLSDLPRIVIEFIKSQDFSPNQFPEICCRCNENLPFSVKVLDEEIGLSSIQNCLKDFFETHVGQGHGNFFIQIGEEKIDIPIENELKPVEKVNSSPVSLGQDTPVKKIIPAKEKPKFPRKELPEEATRSTLPKEGEEDTIPDPDIFKDDSFSQGAFLTSRSLFNSEVWYQNPLYVKAWIWMMGKANHQDVKRGNFTYHRGELYTTYMEFREALKFYQNREKVIPSMKQARAILDWFIKHSMIEKTPINFSPILSPSFHHLSTQLPNLEAVKRQTTRAYIGLRIKLIKYDPYQSLINYKGRPQGQTSKNELGQDKGRTRAGLGHYNKNDKNEISKKNGRASQKKDVDPGVNEFKNHWGETYQKETEQPYNFSHGKEGSLIRTLLHNHSLDSLKELVMKFFKDTQIREKVQQGKIGYTIGVFYQDINRLLSMKAMNPLEQAKREIYDGRKGNFKEKN